ncbi:MAG: cyclodeaminase/cyclohydrolase family protein [Lachnospiraceae bacterium]|nr:cyclodeaminase/cyclohydrolase family protein [Lachnospiraceae bacterium]
MDFTKLSCEEFTQILSSKEPVPGGGGASALVGALGCALGNMVGSLTIGKKKYADVQDDIIALKEKADALQTRLLNLVAEDAKAFEPLSQAYGLPKETEDEKQHREEVMAVALHEASKVPLAIMHACCEVIELLEEFAEKGSRIALSDAGVGAAFAKSALFGASLNVFINTKLMKDRELAQSLDAEADGMLNEYGPRAEAVFERVMKELR